VLILVAVAVGASSAPAAGIRLQRPGALAVGRNGVIYIADSGRHQILARLPSGRLEVIAGTGKAGFAGDGGRAVDAELNAPAGMTLARDDTLYFADPAGNRVRAISPRGIIRTVAGNGKFGWVESGTRALAARLGGPTAVTIGPDRRLYIAATGWGEILRLSANGTLTRIAGIRGPEGVHGVGKPATRASADGPSGLAFDRSGNLFIAGMNTKTLLMVTPGGTMTLPDGKSGFYPRGFGCVVTGPDGRVLAVSGTAIVRLTPHGTEPIRDLGRRPVGGVGGFAPEGIAVAPNGAVYTDTWVGNGFANKTTLIEIRPGGRVRVLWKS